MPDESFDNPHHGHVDTLPEGAGPSLPEERADVQLPEFYRLKEHELAAMSGALNVTALVRETRIALVRIGSYDVSREMDAALDKVLLLCIERARSIP